MNLLDVLYYHYFLFYRKVLKDPDPHFATVLSFSFSESLLINGFMDIIALKWFCYQIALWIQFGIVIILIYCNYLLFHRSGRVKELLKERPVIRNSRVLSVTTTILFFLVTVSWLFLGPIYGKRLLSQCR